MNVAKFHFNYIHKNTDYDKAILSALTVLEMLSILKDENVFNLWWLVKQNSVYQPF